MIRGLLDTFTINLTRNQQALVDERDWYALRKFKWCASWNEKTKSYYAKRGIRVKGRRTTQLMHRRILDLSSGDKRQADHLNHNTLDNRRRELRIVTNRANHENRRDQSKYGAGIQKLKFLRSRPYRALVQIDGRMVHVGCYATSQEAQNARDEFLGNLPEAKRQRR